MKSVTEESSKSRDEVVLVTGFPSFTAIRLIRKIVASDPRARLVVLARERRRQAAQALVTGLPGADRQRIRVVLGDVFAMDLGLSGPEVRELTGELTTVHHLAGVYRPNLSRELAERVHVEGTRGVLELAGECRRLRRLCLYSTAFVSGKRKGVVLEDELDEGQTFRDVWEETKFAAEKLAGAAARRLPITTFRPGLIVGDSRSGAIGKLDGPHRLIELLVSDPGALGPVGRSPAPLHVVPIDFVIDAAYALSLDEKAAGGTFHLTDPSPLPARHIVELIAERTQARKPRDTLPAGLARAVLRSSGLERLTRASRAFLESLDQLTFYDCRGTLARLDGTSIACPTFDSYVDALVGFERETHEARRLKAEDDEDDPFD